MSVWWSDQKQEKQKGVRVWGEDGESGIVPFDSNKLCWSGCDKDASLG